MASNRVPNPTLDGRNGDQGVAEAIQSFPSELSDKSDSNPAVVIAEAFGVEYDKLLFTANQWPQALMQKVLNVIGIPLQQATPAQTTLQFTLPNPQPSDVVYGTGSLVSTPDGNYTFQTVSPAVIPGYSSLSGSIWEVQGSNLAKTYQTLGGTTFLTASTGFVNGVNTAYAKSMEGMYLRIRGGSGNYYPIGNYSSGILMNLSVDALVTESGVADVGFLADFLTGSAMVGQSLGIDRSNNWNIVSSVDMLGEVATLTTPAQASANGLGVYGTRVGTAQAYCLQSGALTNVGPGTVTLPVSNFTGNPSIVNISSGSGGADLQSISGALAASPALFSRRDVACSAEDYAEFAVDILGRPGRSVAMGNMNGTANVAGFMSVAMLSPQWSVGLPVSVKEMTAVLRDLSGRSTVGTTVINLPANLQTLGTDTLGQPGAIVIKDGNYSDDIVRSNVAAALNTYLTPNSYDWGRTIYTGDLIEVVAEAAGLDRLLVIDGVVAVSADCRTSTSSVALTQSSAIAICGSGADALNMIPRQTFLYDTVGKTGYLVIAISGNQLTLDRPYSANNNQPATFQYLNVQDVALASWFSLPLSTLSTDPANPPIQVLIGGSQ